MPSYFTDGMRKSPLPTAVATTIQLHIIQYKTTSVSKLLHLKSRKSNVSVPAAVIRPAPARAGTPPYLFLTKTFFWCLRACVRRVCMTCRLQELKQEAAIPRRGRRGERQVGAARAEGEETERPEQVS